MSNASKLPITFEVVRSNEHGYEQHKLHISVGFHFCNTKKQLEGTVDNKDGYGDREAAARMGRTFQALLDTGHETFYDWSYGSHQMTIRYQVYAKIDGGDHFEYCRPEVQWPHDLEGARWALPLVEAIGKKVERARARAWVKKQAFEGVKVPALPGRVDNESLKQLAEVVDALRKLGAVEVKTWKEPGSTYSSRYYVPA